jgi:ABC-type branched-subunit amino acid transport system substrate-binding protein
MAVCWLTACARVPVTPTIEKTEVPIQTPEPEPPIVEQDQPKISLVDILSAEAKKFFAQKNYQDALFIYNQALSQADENTKPGLISEIESLLSKTPAKDIQEFSYIKNIHIPKPLLLYWLGLNLALEDHTVKAGQVLETFMFQYPDHPYYEDAADLAAVIKASFFSREKIGCLLPLTGKYAIFGQQALSGIQLAVQELSKKYEKNFILIVKDTEADPKQSVEGVRALYKENVAGIIGPLLMVNEAGQAAEELGIPMIALTQKNDFPLQGEYLFANFITPEMQARTLGAYLFRDLGIKRVAILYPDEKYGQKYMELFWDIVDDYGGKVVGVEAYDGRKTDFTEPIQKLTGEFFPVPESLKPKPVEIETYTGPGWEAQTGLMENQEQNSESKTISIDFQALFIPDSPSRVNLILPQLAFNDARNMVLVGTNLWHDASILKDAKGYNQQAVITDGFFDDSRNAVTAQFTREFESVFNERPKFLEAISYDNASILFLTAMDPAIDSRQALRDMLRGSRIFDGVTGTTRFDRDGVAHRNLFLMTIKQGKFVEISR